MPERSGTPRTNVHPFQRGVARREDELYEFCDATNEIYSARKMIFTKRRMKEKPLRRTVGFVTALDAIVFL